MAHPNHLCAHACVEVVSLALDRLMCGDVRQATTAARYRATLNWMSENGLTPDGVRSSRSRHYEARAAVTYYAAQAVQALAEPLCNAEPLDAEQATLVRAAHAILVAWYRSPTGARMLPSQEVENASRRSRRTEACWLGRSASFRRGTLMTAAARLGAAPQAIAVLSLTGSRPAEIAQGVGVDLAGPSDAPDLILTVPGSKVDGTRGKGYAWRRLVLPGDSEQPSVRFLVQVARANAGRVVVACPADYLRRCLKRVATAVFGRERGAWVTPYVLRHVVAARAHARGGLDYAARCLGHRRWRSTRRYGGFDDGGATPLRVDLPGREPARAPVDAPQPSL